MRKKHIYINVILLLGFMAGIHQGRIAIWCNEDPEPYMILPYYANMLPEADQAALEKGVPLTSGDALIQFIEDYCS